MKPRLFAMFTLALTAGACASVLGLRQTVRRPFEHRAHAVAGVSCTRCHDGVAAATNDSAVQLPQDAVCIACHDQPEQACELGRKEDCTSCHGTPEAKHFAEQARLHLRFAHDRHVTTLDGNCVRCHEAVQRDGVRLLPKMADCLGCHEHSADFDLRACGRCHENLETEDVRPSSHVVHDEGFANNHGAQASAQRDLCATCHSDNDCAGCHGAQVPALRSQLELSRPRLEGIHRAGFVARHALEARSDPGLCATCHRPQTCQRCHDDVGVNPSANGSVSPHRAGWVGLVRNDHGPAARRDPLSCASCHGGAGEMLCVSCHQVGGIGKSPHPPGWTSPRRTNERPCSLCH